MNDFQEIEKSNLNPLSESQILSIEEALIELQNFNKSVYEYSPVKSQNLISEIAVCSIPNTKSDSDEKILAYVINYKNNAGFAVLSADKN